MFTVFMSLALLALVVLSKRNHAIAMEAMMAERKASSSS
ncbi:MAG: hypothetical protein JWQ76_186 [Ramlibacter sp.]|nr:hypothetical protein [Ramlibacter sp.]